MGVEDDRFKKFQVIHGLDREDNLKASSSIWLTSQGGDQYGCDPCQVHSHTKRGQHKAVVIKVVA